jgi:hypothetical protein
MKTNVALAALALAAGIAPLACADTLLYRNTFESGTLGSEWSSNSGINAEARSVFSKFNGRYSTNYTRLTLPALPAFRPMPGPGGNGGAQWYEVTLTFDFYCIDSWDGDVGFGPDRFRVQMNDTQVLRNTFANQPGCTDNYPGDPTHYGEYGFNSRWNDSIYRGITRTVQYSGGSNLVFLWADEGLQGMGDESWGIDNVTVTYTIVPAPATAMLGLAGGLCLNRRRRA